MRSISVKLALVLVGWIWLVGSSVFAQAGATVDSLRSALGQAENVSERASLHNQIAWGYHLAYHDSALHFADVALRYAEQHQLIEATLVAQLQQAEILRVSGDLETAQSKLVLARTTVEGDAALNRYATRLSLCEGNLALSQRELEDAQALFEAGYALSETNQPEWRAQLAMRLAYLSQRYGEVEKAEAYLLEALASAERTKLPADAIKATNNLGNLYARQQDYAAARQYYQQSLDLSVAQYDQYGESRAYLNLGNLYLIEGNWTSAIEQYVASAALKEELGDLAGLAKLHNNIGTIYQEQERLEEGLRYYRKSADYYTSVGDSSKLAEVRVNMGSVLVTQDFPSDGIYLLRLALKQLDEQSQADIVLAARLNLAIGYQAIGEYERSLIYLPDVEAAALAQQDEEALVFAWNLLGAGHFYLDDYAKAVSYYEQSESLALKLGLLKEQKKALFGLYEAEAAAGHFETSLRWLEQYSAVKDSLFDQASRRTLLELQEHYEADQKAQEIASLNIENRNIALEGELKDQQLNRSLLVIGLVVAIAALITVYFIFQSRRQKERMAYESQRHNERIDQLMTEQEVATLEAVYTTQQQERRQIARDLHDNLGNYLATLKHQHEAHAPDPHDEAAHERFSTTANLISQAYREVRSISHQMATGQGVEFNLIPAIEQLVERVQSTGQFTLQFHHFGQHDGWPQETEHVLYKVVQELLSNVLKHAQADQVTIQLNQSQEELTLMVEDNGRGFDPSTIGGQGIGLNNVNERIAALGGRCEVNSGAGRGTTVTMLVPYPQNELHHD